MRISGRRVALLPLTSLLLLAAVAVLWARSFRAYEGKVFSTPQRQVVVSHYRGNVRVTVFGPLRLRSPARGGGSGGFSYRLRLSPRGTRYYLNDRDEPVQADGWDSFLSRQTLGPRGTVRQFAGLYLACRNVPPPGLDFSIAQASYAAAAVLAALPLLWPAARAVRRRRRRSRRLCSECGYDLRASAGPCPECGTPTMPAAAPVTPAPATAD